MTKTTHPLLRVLLAGLLACSLIPISQVAFAEDPAPQAAQTTAFEVSDKLLDDPAAAEESAAGEDGSASDEEGAAGEDESAPAEEAAPSPAPGPAVEEGASPEAPAKGDATAAPKEEADAPGAADETAAEEAVAEIAADEPAWRDGASGAVAEADAFDDVREASVRALAEQPLATSVGDTFLSDDNNAGLTMRFTITGSGTVSLGAGRSIAVEEFDYEIPWHHEADFLEDYSTLYNYRFAGEVAVPATVNYGGRTYTVTAIGPYAFAPMTRSYYDQMGNKLTQTVSYRFTSVRIPSTVASIGLSAFSGCGLLKKITFEGSSGLTAIGSEAFYQCTSLGDNPVAACEQLRSLGSRAFASTRFAAFTVPASVTSLGADLFSSAWVETVTFAAGSALTVVGDGAFSNARSLTAVRGLPETVTTLGASAFSGTALTSFAVPQACTSLGDGLFADCTELQSVRFSGTGVTRLPRNFVERCTALTALDLPETITYVDDRAFAESGLERIAFGPQVTYVGAGALADCAALTEATFAAESLLLRIEEELFDGCARLASVSLPAAVRFVGAHAFRNCTALTRVDVPRSCKTIEAYAFENCTALATVVFKGDASKLSVASSAFYRCNAVQAVVWEGKRAKSVSFLNSEPTIYCTVSYYASQQDAEAGAEPVARYSVRRNEVPATAPAEAVWQGALQEAPDGQRWVAETGFSLTDEIDDSFALYAVAARPDYAVGETFTGTTVEGVSFVCQVTSAAASGSPEVSVGTGVLGERAVAAATPGACTLPETVVGEDGRVYRITSIAAHAFSECARLMEVTIPASCTEIGTFAFYRCLMLTTVRFEADAQMLQNNYQFSGCNSIALVVFGGKKANVSFGMSDPDIYYTVKCYDSKDDLRRDRTSAVLTLRRGAKLASFADGDVLEFTAPRQLPPVPLGYQWAYEPGFSGTASLADSCYMVLEGVGFQAPVSLKGSSDSTALCWFKPLSTATADKPGTCQVGVGLDGFPAVAQSVAGTVVLPASVTDPETGLVYEVTEVGSYAFGATDEELRPCYVIDVDFSQSTIASIQQRAFWRADSLTGVIELPATLALLGESAFEGCGLAAVRFASESPVAAIATRAFATCPNLATAVISEGIATVGPYAFFNATALTVTEGGAGLRTIERNAFEGTALRAITIPAGVTAIGAQAFYRVWRATELHFLGDARSMTFGTQAFALDDLTTPSAPGKRGTDSLMRAVYFHGKKSSTVRRVITTGTANSATQNEYVFYYALDLYASYDDFVAGRKDRTVFCSEEARYESVLPEAGLGNAWQVEDGFALTDWAADSLWAYKARDLSYGRVVVEWPEGDNLGQGDVRYYTGDYIKPLSVQVQWGYGSSALTLEEGRDWTFDTSKGTRKDGYVNNLFMSTAAAPASINLKGLGNYAGALKKTFTISGQAALGEESAQVDAVTAVYTGLPQQPRPTVRHFDRYGNPTVLTLGSDYTVDRLNAVDVGTYGVTVRGAGTRFSQDTVLLTTLTIMPLDINQCDIGAPRVQWGDDGACTVQGVSIVNPHTGAELVMGRDFTAAATATDAAGRVQLRIRGVGNFAGFYTDEVVPAEPEAPSTGEGTGDGAGNGSGDGAGAGLGATGEGDGTGGAGVDGAGTGAGTADGAGVAQGDGDELQGAMTGTAAAAGRPTTLSVDAEKADHSHESSEAAEPSPATLRQGAGAAGGESSGGEADQPPVPRLFKIFEETPPLAVMVEVGASSLALIGLVVFGAVALGAVWRRRRYQLER